MTPVHASYGIAVLLAVSAACGGTDTTVVDNPVTAAQIDDVAPAETPFDPSLTYTGRYGETHNHSTDRYRFDVAAFRSDAERVDAEKLFASHAAHLVAHPDGIPSVQTIGTYAKQLDDTIYAGVEHAALAGLAPTIAPKRALLTESLAWLAAHRSAGGDDAIARIAAALELGGATADAPGDLANAIARVKADFLARPSIAKPFGFYTWSDELRRIWQQDRLLQQPLTNAAACSFAQAIVADAARATRYKTLVDLYGRLTNPVRATLVDLLPIASDASCLQKNEELAFLSTSRSVEVGLYEKLYPNGIPADANLMQDLINAIRSGAVDLTPKPESGWYQWQEYALETLLVTDKAEERSKIAFMARYKKRLQEAFETMLTQHRETHAKQSDTVTLSAAAEPPTPAFRVEPLATVYVRHARSYVFLEAALDAVEGTEFLDKGVAVDASGVTSETLRARIRRTRDLFYGLYLVSSQDVGMAPKLGAKGDPEASTWKDLASAAAKWLETIASDPIASSDVRVMIPIANIDDKRARYWAVIGVRTTIAGYSFIKGGVDVSPPKPEDQSHVPLPTEQFLEVTSSATPLSRDELRALCDQYKTADAIKAAIEAR